MKEGTFRSARQRWAQQLVQLLNRLRLPSASVLPAAGGIVGIYAGLAAGVFANLLGIARGLALAPARLVEAFRPGSLTTRALGDEWVQADWHGEYLLVGIPIALGALLISRLIEPGEERDEVKRRLRVLGLLVLGGLALYYPLVGLSVLNEVFGTSPHALSKLLGKMPWWSFLLAPTLGGLAVGHLLKNKPELHGHGVPEVISAVNQRSSLSASGGLLKLLASAVTIGSGGSAGREGPIVYAGGAFASAVARTLGFTRKELAILMASGAGAGIAASFNAPIAGAIFAMEIILREFQLRVLSPIILASVTATLVARGVLGTTQVLERMRYVMVSGYEIITYVLLGLTVGLLTYAFVRSLHHTEDFFGGHKPNRVSRWLGQRSRPMRAALGGAMVGALAMVNPAVWGSGHAYLDYAIAGKLGLSFLIAACLLKLVATSITIGSGGSGGTFFPAAVIGAMAGGVFGNVAHRLLPSFTATSGAYALVGMGGAVAALNRGPLTGLVMLYELSGNSAIILPLMVTCTISSALCHALVVRRSPRGMSDEELLSATPVRMAMHEVDSVFTGLGIDALADQLLAAEDGVLPVADEQGRAQGLVQLSELRTVWRDRGVGPLLVTADLLRPARAISTDQDLQLALERMDNEDLDALPVIDPRDGSPRGVITRSAIRRLLQSARTQQHEHGVQAVAATELGIGAKEKT